ncbi:FlaD/FlaE family flagellar protein [Halosolutus amylolyticus]|uniref:FlaD/FlaE family flagellar protein n=1 Tax=Halosolutus amylolyticus TaxID=2932267 RepID=A0ABD5PPW0_9EURY|nr:FlaD/FlaE family flagellar protein [Halosolutus amylolyticus]
MDLGLDNLRELLEDFLGNSGGRRGRRREQRREEADDGAEPTADAQTQDVSAAEAAAESGDEEAQPDESTESDGGSGGLFGRGSGTDDGEDLQYRIDELEEELEDKQSELGALRDSQEQVSSQVEEMNDTVRQLLGVYDQLTDDVNPFTGEGEAEGGFGVFGEDRTEPAETGFGLESDGPDTGRDETVSFDDLKGVIEDAAEAQAARQDGGEPIAFEDEADDDTRVEVQATESVDDPGPEADVDAEEPVDDGAGESDGASDDGDVTLTTLADTYATDIIVFEWLTDLVRTAGPAATLRAISYYAEIGWIDEEVRAQLEAVLSGPDLDIHVDPGQVPDELTAEDHADSYTYIMKLNEIHETRQEVDP